MEPERQRLYYETLIEVSPTAIVTVSPELLVTSWNPAAERLFGYRAEEAIGQHIDALVAADAEIRDEAVAVGDALFDGPVERITRRTRKGGALVDVAIRGAPITLEGEVVGVYALYEDIGELVRQRRFYESLVESSPAAVVMVDREWRVTLWNPAAEVLFGFGADEAIGTNLDDLVSQSADVRAEAAAYSAEAWSSTSFHRIARRERRDGSPVDVEISAVPVLHEGEAIGYYVLYHDITELERTRRQLARFLPRQVAEGLQAGALTSEDGFERRKITVLFADMVGFTDLSESLEPEELSEVLNEYIHEMASAVLHHDGTLDKFMGDGIMAIFGAPERLEETEAAWAAVQAAIEIRDRCRALGARLRERGIPADLDIRVGLNTGHCTVGVFGSEVIRAYTAVGFAVNVAARLQTAGDPGSILCGFRTYALVQDRVLAERREPLSVKGASRPVEAWQIDALVGSALPDE